MSERYRYFLMLFVVMIWVSVWSGVFALIGWHKSTIAILCLDHPTAEVCK